MENLDFRVGDKVFSLLHGNGIITKIFEHSLWFPICVYCHDKDVNHRNEFFTNNGKYNRADKFRTLYHGHDLNIIIEEKKPIRHRWSNIYKHRDTYTMRVDHTS